MTAAADRAAAVIAPAARALAPVRTGALVATIAATGDGGDVIVSAGSIRVNYAAVQEYGSPRRHVPAHPYLGPAVDATEPTTVAAYADQVDHIVGTVKGV
jgi:HK97 gp10 family phage protein